MIVGQHFWFCKKCNQAVIQKAIGRNKPRTKMSCKCYSLNIGYDELVKTGGHIKNKKCLDVGWIKVKVVKTC